MEVTKVMIGKASAEMKRIVRRFRHVELSYDTPMSKALYEVENPFNTNQIYRHINNVLPSPVLVQQSEVGTFAPTIHIHYSVNTDGLNKKVTKYPNGV